MFFGKGLLLLASSTRATTLLNKSAPIKSRFKSPPSFLTPPPKKTLPFIFSRRKKGSRKTPQRKNSKDGRRCDYHHHHHLLLLPSFDDWRALDRVGRVLFRVERKNAAAVFFSRSDSDEARQEKRRRAFGFDSTSRGRFFPRNAPFGIDSDGQSR